MSDKLSELKQYSNPKKAQLAASRYLGKGTKLFVSTRKDKKYMVQGPHGLVHFGQMGYEDYTKHHDLKRRRRYLTRANKIKGQWRSDPYSPNNLAIHILW
jgi:hypothetical protein